MRPALILITDVAFDEDRIASVVASISAEIAPGAFCVQLRDKREVPSNTSAPRARLAERLRGVTARAGQMLVVNGDLELARAVSADGVHLPGAGPSVAAARAALGQGAWISIAAHADDDVRAAVRDGADAALVSPIFATPGKGTPRGTAAIHAARALGPALGIYALGGVDASNVRACIEAGATGVAAIRALLGAPDPCAVAREMLRAATCVAEE